MKQIGYFLSIILLVWFSSCEQKHTEANFEDLEKLTILDYLTENKDNYSSFLSILEKAKLDKTLSAYNPDGDNYTLFLPDNKAINDFITKNGQFNSLNDLLNNTDFVNIFARYHVVNMEVHTNDFPFGAFSEPTLSNDYLTVSFIIEKDTSYYKINNEAAVFKPNIETSNGYVHLIQNALTPVTRTSYEWLEKSSGFSIFKSAVDATGLKTLINTNLKVNEKLQPVTLIVEHDTVFTKRGIKNFTDLANFISPGNTDYKNVSNPLYNFVGFHVLAGNLFINDFTGKNTNYTTNSEIPLNINGFGLDIFINKGKEVFETKIIKGDTIKIDYIKFNYDQSNVITQSGAVHLIDRILRQFSPTRTIVTFEFWEESLINNKFRKQVGTHLIEDKSSLSTIKWSGADLFFVENGDQNNSAWGNDYYLISGDFAMSYTVPKIIQGKYKVFMGAEAFNSQNAVVEVYIDGKKMGSTIDLTRGGSATNPFTRVELGIIDFKKYSEHVIEVKPLIPGRFLWDYIRFEPI